MSDKRKSRRGAFFLRLALHNVLHNRRVMLPFLVCSGVIFGVYLLIGGLMFSDTLHNLPTGMTAAQIFGLGLALFTIFAFCFLLYINRYLIAQRKKEFGLYAVLGLEQRHIGRVLFWENALVLGAGLLAGCLLAAVFGRLIFWILLRIIRAAPGSSFSLAPRAFALTGGLFVVTFAAATISNIRQVRRAGAIELLQSARKGEKEDRALWPITALGAIALIASYYLAWTTDNPMVALYLFFLLAVLVIFATFALFAAGSVTLLDRLRKRATFYYQPTHFVTISGLRQRMRQNARSLSMICILSVMLIVSASGTLALYLGQEDMLSGMYPYDVCVTTEGEPDDEAVRAFERTILSLADERRITLSADPSKLTDTPPEDMRFLRNNYAPAGARRVPLETLLYFGNTYVFDVSGAEEDCIAFCEDVRAAYRAAFDEVPTLIVSEVFTARQEGYGLYGGLLFLGVFFGLLFLAVTVLLIYFKQITEGYEDRARFVILQQVGMDDALVRRTIDQQVLWMFFLPLGMAALHMVFASRIMARMLQSFMLYDWGLVLRCIGGVLIVYALVYLVVYRMTAKAYYRIVRR